MLSYRGVLALVLADLEQALDAVRAGRRDVRPEPLGEVSRRGDGEELGGFGDEAGLAEARPGLVLEVDRRESGLERLERRLVLLHSDDGTAGGVAHSLGGSVGSRGVYVAVWSSH